MNFKPLQRTREDFFELIETDFFIACNNKSFIDEIMMDVLIPFWPFMCSNASIYDNILINLT